MLMMLNAPAPLYLRTLWRYTNAVIIIIIIIMWEYDYRLKIPTGMLTILVKTALNTNNNTLAKVLPIPILLQQYFLLFITFSNVYFFPWSSINKVNRMTDVEKMAKLL